MNNKNERREQGWTDMGNHPDAKFNLLTNSSQTQDVICPFCSAVQEYHSYEGADFYHSIPNLVRFK